MKNRPARKIGKINSLEDLRLEKARLQMDILQKENQIQSDYHQILDRLTFRNLIRNIKDDVAMTTNITSRVISIGKKILSKKKKKKKIHEDRHDPAIQQGTLKNPEEIIGE